MGNSICEHVWQREPDYWWCKKCHATKRKVKGIMKCWDKDGNLMTLIEDGGENEVAAVEAMIEAMKRS